MIERFFWMIGRQINRSVRDILHSESFAELKNEVDRTVRSASAGFRSRAEGQNAPYRTADPGWGRRRVRCLPRGSISGVLLILFGSMGLLVALLAAVSIPFIPSMAALPGVLFGFVVPCGGVSGFLLAKGILLRKRVGRYRSYLARMGNATFCPVEELAASVGKPAKFVLKDLKKMIRLNMLPEGHIDDQQTCLMLGEETYEQYLEAQRSMKERQQREESRKKDSETNATIAQGREYLEQIRRANDLLDEDEISHKLDRIEQVSSKIFDYVEQHPEKAAELRRFINYYLPTTLKLVNAYCQFEAQPVQGENITAAKDEIRKALDTIGTAFENLLDSLFGDVTLDISTDITVLENMLAHEGLTGEDFKKKAP